VDPSYRVMRGLELGGRVLRSLGLGGVVERSRERLFEHTGPFFAEVGDTVLCGDCQPHLDYVRQLRRGRESYATELIGAQARPGRTLVDVGAFLGYFTQVAARRGADVIAVEPNPASRRLLEQGLERARLADRARVVAAAFGETRGDAELFLSGGGDTASLHDHDTSSGRVTVPVLVGDEALDGARVDVLKIDVEGGEVAALRGLARTLTQVGSVLAECNPPALQRAGTSPDSLVGELARHGFEVRVIDDDRRALVPWTERAPSDDIVNLWACRS
jgi:FkbM family methyltransferase